MRDIINGHRPHLFISAGVISYGISVFQAFEPLVDRLVSPTGKCVVARILDALISLKGFQNEKYF